MPNVRIFITPDVLPHGGTVATMSYVTSRDGGTSPVGIIAIENDGPEIPAGTVVMCQQRKDGWHILAVEAPIEPEVPQPEPVEPATDADEPVPAPDPD